MATISELMAGKVPGSIKITYSTWSSRAWFQPFFEHKNVWYGLRDHGDKDNNPNGPNGWDIWQEPKKKIKKVLWIDCTACESRKSGVLYGEWLLIGENSNRFTKTNIEAEFEE